MENPLLKLEALYEILEKHLYDFEDDLETQKEFVAAIVKDYVEYLQSQNVVIPKKWHAHVLEEFHDQVEKMLVKKMYGCLSLQDFRQSLQKQKKKRRYFQKKKLTG